MKLRDYKSKTGMVLVWLYLSVCIFFYFAIVGPYYPTNSRMVEDLVFFLLILTLPCGVALVIIFNSFGIFTRGNDAYIGLICGLIGGAVNVLALYFFGYLLTRMFVSVKDVLLSVFRR